MNAKELKLLIPFLDEFADDLGGRSCNDWEFPSDWTRAEKIAFLKEYHEWNGDSWEFSESNLTIPDFAVVSFLASKLSRHEHA